MTSNVEAGYTGLENLEAMEHAHKYNAFLHGLIREHLTGREIMDFGAGAGTFAIPASSDYGRVICVEPDGVLHDHLRQAGLEVVKDLAAVAECSVDAIYSFNVLEHIEDDEGTLRDCAAVLPEGGRLVLLVPAMRALYGTLDVHLSHFRRYEKAPLRQLLERTGFVVDDLRFVNRVAVFGWWLSSRVLKRKVLPKDQLAVFKLIMPLLKLEEKRPPSFGLSLLALARRA